MITIKTTMPKQDKVTPEYRRDVAAAFARFMPDYHAHKNSAPYQVYENGEGLYAIDNNNNWWCRVDDEDSQRVTITYRHAIKNPGVEFAFANWVISCRHGWEIPPASHDGNGVSLRVSVDMDVKLPCKFDEDELSTISFEIPIESVGVFIGSRLIPRAEVIGYTTQADAEVTS